MGRRVIWIFNPVAIFIAAPFLLAAVAGAIAGLVWFFPFFVSQNYEALTKPRPHFAASSPVHGDFNGVILRCRGNCLDVRAPDGRTLTVWLYGLGEPQGTPAQVRQAGASLAAKLEGQRAAFHLRGWDASGRLYVDGRLAANNNDLAMTASMAAGVFPYRAPVLVETAFTQ